MTEKGLGKLQKTESELEKRDLQIEKLKSQLEKARLSKKLSTTLIKSQKDSVPPDLKAQFHQSGRSNFDLRQNIQWIMFHSKVRRGKAKDYAEILMNENRGIT